MIIPAARPKRRASITASLPAPTGGWNARDALADMKPDDAVQMDNYIPGTANVYLRNGSETYATNLGQVTTFTRASTATYIDRAGLRHVVGNDIPRPWYVLAAPAAPYLLVESAATNLCLYSRDLTNAAWTKTNCTALKTQTGSDGMTNGASSITATSANATCLQTFVGSDTWNLTVDIKWVSGTGGTIELTVDNGAHWRAFNLASLVGLGVYYTSPVSGFSACFQIGASTNSAFGFRIPTNGDKFAIDYVMFESGSVNAIATSPIETTNATVARAADVVTYAAGATGATANPVESLISYASGATTKMLAAAGGNIYDATAGDYTFLPIGTGYTSDRWQYENMNGYALLFNGVDTPLTYNGSAIATNSITGVTSSSLIYPLLFKHRLFMIEKNTLSVWYLATDAISGSASELDFSTYCSLGGHMVAMGTWTRDGGGGADDYIVFITSRGEVIVYQGTDPSDADAWALVGVYRIGAPVGQRPILKAGADLIIICEDGFAPLSQVIARSRYAAVKASITDKIRQAASSATTLYKNNFGWEGAFYPQSNLGIFNVPIVEGDTQQQYVINFLNNSWCRFTGLNANCWGLLDEDMYFGSNDGRVIHFDTGTSDDGNDIQGDVKTSFQYFASRSQLKQFRMIRPVVSSDAPVDLAISICLDYEDHNPTTVSTPSVTGAVWDVSPWDTTPWSSGNVIRKDWITVTGLGYSAALHWRTSTNGISIAFNSIDWLYEPGGVM